MPLVSNLLRKNVNDGQKEFYQMKPVLREAVKAAMWNGASTFSIMTLIITTLSIMTLSITTLSIKGFYVTLSIIMLLHYSECYL